MILKKIFLNSLHFGNSFESGKAQVLRYLKVEANFDTKRNEEFVWNKQATSVKVWKKIAFKVGHKIYHE